MPSSTKTTGLNILLKNSQLVSISLTFDTEKSLLAQFQKVLEDFGDIKLPLTYIDVDGQPRQIRRAPEIPEIIASGAVSLFFKAISVLTTIEDEVPEGKLDHPDEEVQVLGEFDQSNEYFGPWPHFGKRGRPDPFGCEDVREFCGRGRGMAGPDRGGDRFGGGGGRMDWPRSDFRGRGCIRGGRGVMRGFGSRQGGDFASRGRWNHSF